MDGIDVITQYILALVPAVSALVGMVVTVGVGIGRIKRANRDTIESVDRVSRKSEKMEIQLAEVNRENIELKRELRKVMAKLEHVHFVDNKEE